MTSRGAATALSKVTWALGIAFVVTSLALTVIAARDAGTGSVVDTILPSDEPVDGAGRRRRRGSAATCCRSSRPSAPATPAARARRARRAPPPAAEVAAPRRA